MIKNLSVDSSLADYCIKESLNIGSVLYQNICDGSSSIVYWGTLDWFVFSLLIVFALFLIVALVVLIKTGNSRSLFSSSD